MTFIRIVNTVITHSIAVFDALNVGGITKIPTFLGPEALWVHVSLSIGIPPDAVHLLLNNSMRFVLLKINKSNGMDDDPFDQAAFNE